MKTFDASLAWERGAQAFTEQGRQAIVRIVLRPRIAYIASLRGEVVVEGAG